MDRAKSTNRHGRSGRFRLPDDSQARRPFWYFLLVGLVSLAVVAGVGLLASNRVGSEIAIGEVRLVGESIARSVAEPSLSDALVAGNQEAIDEFDLLVRDRILDDEALRVKLWSEDGVVVYSDEPELIGQTFGLEARKAEALQGDVVMATISDLSEPSNEFEADFGRLLEVYAPVETPSGEKLLFAVYFPYESVADHSRQIWLAFVPIILGSVLVLGTLNLPLAWSMTRRLRRSQQQREGLLRRAMEASDLEDLRISTELHDGVVQDLAANSFALAAVDDMIRNGDQPEALDVVHRSAHSIRASMLALRSLVDDIYPPNLREDGMETAIEQLLNSAEDAGLSTSFETHGVPALTPELELLTYRTLRETVRNAVKHAEADHLSVTMSNGTSPFVVEITDDGKGFSRDNTSESGLGLRLLSDLANDLGARLDVVSIQGQGTSVRLEAEM